MDRQWCWASWPGILRRAAQAGGRGAAGGARGRHIGREGRRTSACGRGEFGSACFPGPGTPSFPAS